MTGPGDDPTHARHEGDHPEWARFRRPVDAATGAETPAPNEPSASSEPPPAGTPPRPVLATDPAASAGAADPTVRVALAPPPLWRPPTAVEPELESRVRRDLKRGRTIVRLTWIAALASLVLGLVAVRQAALLVAVDRTIVTTEEVQDAGGAFDFSRAVLALIVLVGIALTIRWMRDALGTFDRLNALGVIDGPRPNLGRLGRLRLLWRAAGVPAENATWADVRVGPGRRLASIAGIAVILAAVVGLGAAVWLGAARDADMSRALRVASGIDGALWLGASVLVGAAIDAILWREAAAARALGIFIPLVDAPSRPLVRLLPPALVFAAGIAVVSGRPDPWFVSCPSGSISCDGMLVPADRDGGSSATIWIVYAIHRAAERPVGTLAIAVGGPGASGLEEATTIIDTLDPELVRRYQLLFFDQRGIGGSEGHDCPQAGFLYSTSNPTAVTARAFADACVREAGVDPSTLRRYSTIEAADDLDSIRDHLGIDKIALYGESYGTELAQTYAARHPDRLTALILDGPVDLTKSANEFWSDAAHGFDRVLLDTFSDCLATPDCRANVAKPAAVYDQIVRDHGSPQSVSFADPDGEVRPHPFTAAAFESAVDALLYDPSGRMLVQRAVAAAARDDLVPAARLVNVLGSGEGIGVSSFAYHAITCADYRVSPTAQTDDFRAVQSAGNGTGVATLRTDEVYSAQYPCLFWPYQPASGQRPAPLTTTPFPVLVLGAVDDPITPIAGTEAIAGRLANGFLIRSTGGPHVTFGRGLDCVDRPVLALLLEGRRPATRVIHCQDLIADPYIPLTAARAGSYTGALDAMSAAEDELVADPAFVLWDGSYDFQFGCPHGGYVAVDGQTVQAAIRFSSCQMASGLPLTGLGTMDYASRTVSWQVTAPGVVLAYTATPRQRHVSGTWYGQSVDVTR